MALHGLRSGVVEPDKAGGEAEAVSKPEVPQDGDVARDEEDREYGRWLERIAGRMGEVPDA